MTTPKIHIDINFAADSPRIEEQLKNQGLKLDMDPFNQSLLQRDIDEINRLQDRQILTDAEAGNAFRRIFLIKLHAKPL